MASSGPSSSSKTTPLHKRTYQACRPCRTAKLRCDLGDPDAPDDPPCKRCKRTGRDCVFVGVYQKINENGVGSILGKRNERDDASGLASGSSLRISGVRTGASNAAADTSSMLSSYQQPLISASIYVPSVPPHASSSSSKQAKTARTTPNGSNAEFQFARGEALENPADALRILAAAVEDDDDRPRDEAPSMENEPIVEPGRWNRWIPVRDGLLTAEEATILLHFYAEKINPTHPLVPTQLFQPAHFATLLREPILLAVMVVTAARYLDMGVSFDMTEPQRSRIIQGKIVGWLMQRIGFITMGETSSRTIGTVEALLILSEWPPRQQYLVDAALPEPSAGKETNPCKVYDDLSWTLIGLAVRIALELDLQNEKTYVEEGPSDWISHRRHNTWIWCLSADRHASVRLNRASLVQEMSMSWWDTACIFTKKEGDDTFPYFQAANKWREPMGVAQMTHTIGLLQEMLYATPDTTAELIKTGRYETTLHRLKPELDHTWENQMADLPTSSIFESEAETFTEDELTEIRWRIEFDYVRLYGNSIAMRAAQDRLFRRHRFSKNLQPERLFQTSVIRLAEGSFVIEAVDAAVSLVKCGVAMQEKGVLRYCPCRIFLRLVFASVFLMKAVSLGAVGQPEQDIVDLQYQLIDSLRKASPDDKHVAYHLSALLSRVFPAIPSASAHKGTTQSHAENDKATESVENPEDLSNPFASVGNGLSTLQWWGFDSTTGGHDHVEQGHLDWDTGVVSGFGYDPSSIVSDIEHMLAATGQDQAGAANAWSTLF